MSISPNTDAVSASVKGVGAIQLVGGLRREIRVWVDPERMRAYNLSIADVANASVSPAAPTAYLADDGSFIHPLQDHPDPALTDRDLMVYGLKAGFGRKGAKIGSHDGEAALFRDDMLAFWRRVLFGQPDR